MAKKKDPYTCMYIESVWAMLKYYNIYLSAANKFRLNVYRSKSFLNASRALYFNATSDSKVSLRNRIEIYDYIKRKLAINPSISDAKSILYLIRLFFDIFFTNKVCKVAFDIVNYIIKNFAYVGIDIERLDYVLGTKNEDFRDDKRLKDYLEAKGYDVEYG